MIEFNTDAKEKRQVSVLSARIVTGQVHAVVRAASMPAAIKHLRLVFPLTGRMDIWMAARDEALKYLDIA